MAQRQPIHSRLASNTSSTSRYKLRRSPESRRRALGLVRRLRQPTSTSHASTGSASPPPSSSESRQVLAPLQFNLRRIPSRFALPNKDNMRVVSDSHSVQVGAKRKRVVSGSENALASRGLRSGGGFKRRRGSFNSATTDDDAASTMDVDGHIAFRNSDDSDEDADFESNEDYLISQAPPRQLLRLRKDDLLQLYQAAGLADDTDSLTKQDIVDAIIAARDDVAELPPSSPPGRGDGNSSEYSSDEGNVAGGEETDINSRCRTGSNGLRRRVTVHDVGRLPGSRPVKTRTMSLGHLEHSPTPYRRGTRTTDGATAMPTGRRRTGSLRSSPTTSLASFSFPSPPATRLRSRKVSGENAVLLPNSSSSSSHKAKGKAKQVEFSKDVRIASPTPEELSELTELSDSEQETATVNPSPRRLRSQDRIKISRRVTSSAPVPRTPPKRKAKEKIKDAHEPNGEEGGDGSDVGDEDEVDELASSNSPTPPPLQTRRTPLRRRLRPRRTQTHKPPSDGDDENEEEGEEEETVVDEMEEGEDIDAEGETDEEATETGSVGEDDTTLVTPRKLRSGRIVSEETLVDDAEELAEGSEEEVQDDMSIDEAAADVDVDVDVEESSEESQDDEGSDYDDSAEDVDLTTATAKSLVRLRRDDLVRLCESRALDVEGTKPQLAEALLQWRDHQTETTAPSSTGTVRPPSTARPRANGRRKRSNSQTPPVLLRSNYVHLDEPRTPPLSPGQKEEELELDLESLGLDDKEIPPDKLTKLEKIGSGGFKDVFVGKFKGRKVAIAEFRGQLNAMDIKELKLLGGFDHPNIVRFLGVSIPEDTRVTPVMIVSELCANGDLFDYIRNVSPPSMYRVLHMMLDIAHGLEYLHLRKPSVIHRDCKSSNILITSKGVAKIADFGLAKVKQSTRSMVRSLVGTVNWQAPELWHPHPKYNHKVDVFACGTVYWEMLQWHVPNKKYPWEGMNEHAIYDAVGAKRQRPSIAGLRKQWCPEIVDLIEQMWAHEHADRPTMTQVVTELEGLVRQYR